MPDFTLHRAGLPAVAVIIPARNAEASIAATLDSVLSQDYAGPTEVVVADGSDTPATAEIIRRRYPGVRWIPNPGGTVGFGMNAALRATSGRFVVRCDAHAVLPPEYVRRAVETLERTGAANVGGRQRPVGTTFFERAVAIAMSTPLGAGDARYRLGGAEGPVDTVYLGAFRREALEAVHGYDPTLRRNQDYELNWRLRERGETVWFDPRLAAFYRPRGTLRLLSRQYFDYGRWKRVVLRRAPASVRARHFAAPVLTLGLFASLLLGLFGAPFEVASFVPLTWFFALAAGSLKVGTRRRAPAAFLLPLVLAVMHVSWGIGFLLPPGAPQRRTAPRTPRPASARSRSNRHSEA